MVVAAIVVGIVYLLISAGATGQPASAEPGARRRPALRRRLTPGARSRWALVQGPAELLPVSSSAHLSLLPWLAGWDWDELDPEPRKSFEVALHAGAAAPC